MHPEAYQVFTEQLKKSLEADGRVIGLVAVGSMAQRDYLPDEWSDHDFFVIVPSGNQEFFRTTIGWLPANDQIVFSFRETAHGVKILYRNGHLLEFAVFDVQELGMARINRYRILIDRADIGARLEQIAEQTKRIAGEVDDRWAFGQFLTNLLVGVGRHRRGERLSGGWFVKTSAFRHLISLIRKHVPPDGYNIADSLDELRRFEIAYPQIGETFNAILLLETPKAAQQLLKIADTLLAGRLTDYPATAVEVIKREVAS